MEQSKPKPLGAAIHKLEFTAFKDTPVEHVGRRDSACWSCRFKREDHVGDGAVWWAAQLGQISVQILAVEEAELQKLQLSIQWSLSCGKPTGDSALCDESPLNADVVGWLRAVSAGWLGAPRPDRGRASWGARLPRTRLPWAEAAGPLRRISS